MLITNNEEALRVVCQDVLPEEVGDLRAILERELDRCARLGRPGVGLAAPQIGIAKKMAIIRVDSISLDLVNAKIQNGYDAQMFRDEGCLSFPGRVENTKRFQEVHIVDNAAHPDAMIATGLLAVICQHELDHLNSKLFYDVAMPKLQPIVAKMKVGPNDPCICGSNVKYKKCCRK